MLKLAQALFLSVFVGIFLLGCNNSGDDGRVPVAPVAPPDPPGMDGALISENACPDPMNVDCSTLIGAVGALIPFVGQALPVAGEAQCFTEESLRFGSSNETEQVLVTQGMMPVSNSVSDAGDFVVSAVSEIIGSCATATSVQQFSNQSDDNNNFVVTDFATGTVISNNVIAGATAATSQGGLAGPTSVCFPATFVGSGAELVIGRADGTGLVCDFNTGGASSVLPPGTILPSPGARTASAGCSTGITVPLVGLAACDENDQDLTTVAFTGGEVPIGPAFASQADETSRYMVSLANAGADVVIVPYTHTVDGMGNNSLALGTTISVASGTAPSSVSAYFISSYILTWLDGANLFGAFFEETTNTVSNVNQLNVMGTINYAIGITPNRVIVGSVDGGTSRIDVVDLTTGNIVENLVTTTMGIATTAGLLNGNVNNYVITAVNDNGTDRYLVITGTIADDTVVSALQDTIGDESQGAATDSEFRSIPAPDRTLRSNGIREVTAAGPASFFFLDQL